MSKRLFSYKLTHDTGFAPNPFFGVMTLATCKPGIRDTKRKGDWIAGFTSKKLCGDEVGRERLLFLALVAERLRFEDYFFHSEYRKKIPDPEASLCVLKAGDNIYEPDGKGGYKQLENSNHDERAKARDLKSEWVLICEEFYYFGESAVPLPEEARPNLPRGQTRYGYKTSGARSKRLISFIREHFEQGIHDQPHTWCEDDMSWKSH